MKLLCGFGDSLTAGAFVAPEQTYLHRLALRFGLEKLQAGVGGNTSSDGLARMEHDVLAHKPDICVMTFGMNDHCAEAPGRPKIAVEQFGENIREMLRRLRAIDCLSVLCTIHPILLGDENSFYYSRHPREWYGQGGAQAWIGRYNDTIRQMAKLENTELADIEQHWLQYMAKGGLLSDLLLTPGNSGRNDGVHAAPAGHEQYADCIALAFMRRR